MGVRTTLDRLGRVVIPKRTRDHFGLAPGSDLAVIDAEGGILLKPEAPEGALRLKQGVLVFSGEVAGEAEDLVRRQREERIRRFLPRHKG